MDNLSSSELDSPSKTPLFIAIAAILVGCVGLWLGWMGFSRASELEQKLEALGNASDRLAEIENSIADQGSQLDKMATDLNSLYQGVNEKLGEVGDDISKIKKNVRSVAIEAGTAKKMVEELEKSGVKAAAPAPRPSNNSTPSKAADTPTASSKGGVYTIKSGDTLGRIAAAYKISLADLMGANPGLDPRRLRIGQQVIIPASK